MLNYLIFKIMFFQVFLKAGHPVPPIATNWHRHRDPCASGWEPTYTSRIQQFKDIIGPNVAMKEKHLGSDSD